MNGASTKRVAVFLAYWELISVLSNTVKLLNDHDYEVDLFLYRNHLFVETESLRERAGVNVHDLGPAVETATSSAENHVHNGSTNGVSGWLPSSRRFVRALTSRARHVLWGSKHAYLHLCGSDKGIIPDSLIAQTKSIMQGKQYQCLIGIEKSGLIWAGHVAAILRLPFFYYSLELYNADYIRLGLQRTFWFKHLWGAERRFHRKAAGTIVQDSERARVLFEGNGVPLSGANIAYLPVSILGAPYTKRSSFLHETLGIPREKPIVLYFGHIRERRYALDLARVAQDAPGNWVLVMHGFSTPET